MLDSREYSRWLGFARITLESANGDLERGYYNWACFKAQQAAELAVKALMHGMGLPAYGRSVSKLLAGLPSKGINVPSEVVERAKTLDKLYVPTRYPNAWAEGMPHEYYTLGDARSAMDCAGRIISWVDGTWRYLESAST